MRLIDADRLIETIKGTDTTYNPHFAILLNSLINLVNEQPTAYDVDKVVEELDNEQEKWLRGYNQTLAMGMEHLYINLSGRAYGIKSAIDIVKRGGITK